MVHRSHPKMVYRYRELSLFTRSISTPTDLENHNVPSFSTRTCYFSTWAPSKHRDARSSASASTLSPRADSVKDSCSPARIISCSAPFHHPCPFLNSILPIPVFLAPLQAPFGYNLGMSISIYRLIRSRRKTIALVIERDGNLTVRAPLKWLSAHPHLRRNTRRIDQEKSAQSPQLPADNPETLCGRREIPLPGSVLPAHHRSTPASRPGLMVQLSGWQKPLSQEQQRPLWRWYKKQAILLLFERVLSLAKEHRFHIPQLRISSAESRRRFVQFARNPQLHIPTGHGATAGGGLRCAA